MARMIPAYVDDHTPPGERRIFNILAAGPDDWVVLHSLDLAPWNNNLRTEIDFVVIVPDTGILCIEIKSHLNITFNGEHWTPAEIKRSPFKQAADGRFAFYRRLKNLNPGFAGIPVVHCCIFPSADFDLPPNMSVSPWELMDRRTFLALESPGGFCQNLKLRIKKSIAADGTLRILRKPLSAHELTSLVDACVPVQKRRPGAREEIRQREEQLAGILLEQQKPVLRLAEWNPRVIVYGGAGTGKTLIAMELAQQAADRGLRVALLCFNQIVGNWMKQHIAATRRIPPNLVIGRAIQVMAEMTDVSIPTAPPAGFWETELPRQLEDRLTDPDLEYASEFDYIVLDEAQDFLSRPPLWQCLTQFLRGGTEGGAFALFGDFDHQVLQNQEQMRTLLGTVLKSASPARWHLSENCRNYRIVGETALTLSGLGNSVYSGYLRTGGGVENYNIHFYADQADQLATLKGWLKDFKSLGYKPSEITILSFCGVESSAAAELKSAGFKMQPPWLSGDGFVYSSVHAFKGMENKIIILTDVILTDHGYCRDLFYTGMTRATEFVRVLCNNNSRSVLLNWLSAKEK